MTDRSISEISQALEHGERMFRAFRDGAEIAKALANAVQVESETRARIEALRGEAAEVEASVAAAKAEAEASAANMAGVIEQSKAKAEAIVQEARAEAKEIRDKAAAKAKDADARAERALAEAVGLEDQAKTLRAELDALGPAVEKAKAIAATLAGA